MGRKAIPTQLKLAANNPGRRPVNKNEFRPVAEIPDCPKHLKGEAKKEWIRVTTELGGYQMISAVDRGALAMLCTQWGRYVEAEEMIAAAAKDHPATRGYTTMSPNGHPVHAMGLVISNKAIEVYMRLCGEFGLTPAARTGLAPATTQQVLPGFEVVATGDKPEQKTLGSFSKPV